MPGEDWHVQITGKATGAKPSKKRLEVLGEKKMEKSVVKAQDRVCEDYQSESLLRPRGGTGEYHRRDWVTAAQGGGCAPPGPAAWQCRFIYTAVSAVVEWGWTVARCLSRTFLGLPWSSLVPGSIPSCPKARRSPNLSPSSPSSLRRRLQNEMGTVMNSSDETEQLLQPYNFELGTQDIRPFLEEYW